MWSKKSFSAVFVLGMMFTLFSRVEASVVLESFDYDRASGTAVTRHRSGNVLLTQSLDLSARRFHLSASDGTVNGSVEISLGVNGPDTIGVDIALDGRTASAVLIYTRNSPPSVSFDPNFSVPDFLFLARDFANSNLGKSVAEYAANAEEEIQAMTGEIYRNCPGTGNPERLEDALTCLEPGYQWWWQIVRYTYRIAKSIYGGAACIGQVIGCGIGPGDYSECIVDSPC
jgi:hypothetical protein